MIEIIAVCISHTVCVCVLPPSSSTTEQHKSSKWRTNFPHSTICSFFRSIWITLYVWQWNDIYKNSVHSPSDFYSGWCFSAHHSVERFHHIFRVYRQHLRAFKVKSFGNPCDRSYVHFIIILAAHFDCKLYSIHRDKPVHHIIIIIC